MERKEMEDREQRAGLDSPERASAPDTDDAISGGAEKSAGRPDERVVGSSWWEGGSRPEEAAEEEPDTHRSAGYIYRGVRYGEPTPQPTSQPPDDDDDPVDTTVAAVMSEFQPPVPPAQGEEAREPFVESPWWEVDSTPVEAAEAEPEAGAGEVASGAPYRYRGTAYGEAAPAPTSQPPDDDDPVDTAVAAVMSEDQTTIPPFEREAAAEPVVESSEWVRGSTPEEAAGVGEVTPDDDDPMDMSVPAAMSEDQPVVPPTEVAAAAEPIIEPPWWGGGSTPETAADDNELVDTAVRAAMSEDQPVVPPAEVAAAAEPIIEPPWWGGGSTPEETAEAEPEAGAGELTPGAPYRYRETVYDESVPAPTSQPPAEPDDDEPVDTSVPAAMSENQPTVSPAERGKEDTGEDPASPAGLSAAAEALPEGAPVDLIRSIVAEVCPDEMLLVETAEVRLPEWAPAAVTTARDDLDRRLAERKPIDASEYLRLAIVENVMGLHEEADGHLKEALPRSDRFGPALNALAVTSLARGKIAPAIVYCKEALRETGGDDSVRAAASSNLGDLYDLQGDAARATEAYETAISSLEAQEDSRRLSRLHLRIGRLYQRQGQADKARPHLSDSVRLFKDSGDAAGQVQSLAALGSALTESGLHDLALRNFEEAVRICLRTGDKPDAALVQDELGVAYMVQDQLTRALAYFESALSLHRELGNHKGEAATLSNMGKIHDSRGEVDAARRFYEAAQEINRELGQDVGEAKRPPQLEYDDQESVRAKLRKAEELLSRAGAAEQQQRIRGG